MYSIYDLFYFTYRLFVSGTHCIVLTSSNVLCKVYKNVEKLFIIETSPKLRYIYVTWKTFYSTVWSIWIWCLFLNVFCSINFSLTFKYYTICFSNFKCSTVQLNTTRWTTFVVQKIVKKLVNFKDLIWVESLENTIVFFFYLFFYFVC